VKPDNIMLTRDWELKLMDFGLVKDAQGLLKLLESEDILAGHAFAENLDRGMLAGSPEYMAPEQFTDTSVEDPEQAQTDTWTDVYSLGLILVQLLTGEKLFPFDSRAKDRAEFANKLLIYLRARAVFEDSALRQPPRVPPELWKIVSRAIRRDPRRRYRTATDLGWDIERFVQTGSAAEHDDEATSSFDVDKFLGDHGNDANAAMETLIAQGLTDPTGEFRLQTGEWSAASDDDPSVETRKLDFGDLAKIYNTDPMHKEAKAAEARRPRTDPAPPPDMARPVDSRLDGAPPPPKRANAPPTPSSPSAPTVRLPAPAPTARPAGLGRFALVMLAVAALPLGIFWGLAAWLSG
jgi:serine/threonine protein kinase